MSRYCRADGWVYCDVHGDIHERWGWASDRCIECGWRLAPAHYSTPELRICRGPGEHEATTGYDPHEDGTVCWADDWRPIAILTDDRNEFREGADGAT